MTPGDARTPGEVVWSKRCEEIREAHIKGHFGRLRPDFCDWCVLLTALADLERQVEEMVAALPDTFFSDRSPSERVLRMVREWQREITANQVLEGRAEAAERERANTREDLVIHKELLADEREELRVHIDRLNVAERELEEMREALYDVVRDLVSAIGPHTRSCEVCKAMLRRHAETIVKAKQAAALRGASLPPKDLPHE